MSHCITPLPGLERATSLLVLLFVGTLLVLAKPISGQTTKSEKPRRARLPQSTAFPDDIFFKDAFREALVGSRPALLGRSRPAVVPSIKSARASLSDGSTYRWSAIVSADTLEDEVKALQISVDALLTTPARFSSGGFREVRREFSELAMLFAVIGEYDGNVRWKEIAPVARDRFARAAANAKVSSLQAFNEAKQRKLDLQTLVRGGTLDGSTSTGPRAAWDRVCDRAPLMERLDMCYEQRLAPWMASVAEFKSKADDIRREAELLRLVAEVLTREGMEQADDDDYAAYCRQLGKAAQSVLDALQREDYQSVRRAETEIRRACDRCHEDYRT